MECYVRACRMGIEMDLVQATLDAVQTLSNGAGNAASRQAVSSLFSRLRNTPEAEDANAAEALEALHRGEASARELDLVRLLLNIVLDRDREIVGLAADVRRRANITITNPSRGTGFGNRSTNRGNVISTPTESTRWGSTSEASAAEESIGPESVSTGWATTETPTTGTPSPGWATTEPPSPGWATTEPASPAWDPVPPITTEPAMGGWPSVGPTETTGGLTSAGGGSLPRLGLIPHLPTHGSLRTSPSTPLKLTLEVVNHSSQHQVVVLDAHGPGHRAVHLPVTRLRLRGLEATEVELHLRPDLQVRPDIYITQLRVFPDGDSTGVVTAPLRFTVLPDPGVEADVWPASDDRGAADVNVLNTGNVDLHLEVMAACGGKPMKVDPPDVTLPVGRSDYVRVHLPRSFFSTRPIQFDLVLSERSGLRAHERLAVTLPPMIQLSSGPTPPGPTSTGPTSTGPTPAGPRSRGLSGNHAEPRAGARRPLLAGVAAALVLGVIGASTLFGNLDDDQPVAGALLPNTPQTGGAALCPKIPQADRAPATSETQGEAKTATMGGAVIGGVNVQPAAGLVLVGSNDRRVHAFDLVSLKERWFSPCLAGAVVAQPTVAGSDVFALTANGTVYKFALKGSGQQKVTQKWQAGGPTLIKPTLSGDALIVPVITKTASLVKMYSTKNGDALPAVTFDEDIVQSPTSARKARVYVAHDVDSVSVLKAPAGGTASEPLTTLASGVPGARLRYVAVRADKQTVDADGRLTEAVVATGEVDQTPEDDETAVDSGGETVPATGVLVNWPAGVRGRSEAPMVVYLAGAPGRATLTGGVKDRLAYVPVHEGRTASLVTVDLRAGEVVRQQRLNPVRSQPANDQVRPSSPVLAAGYIALTWGRCLYIGRENRDDLRAEFCDSADIQGPAGFDDATSPTAVYVAGRSGRLRKIAL